MITLDSKLLKATALIHTSFLKDIISQKREIFSLCLKYLPYFDKTKQIDFEKELKQATPIETIKIKTINWFLKDNIRKKKKSLTRKISSSNNTANFFNSNYRRVSNAPNLILLLEEHLAYFDNNKIEKIIGSLPNDLINEQHKFDAHFKKSTKSSAQVVSELVAFFFDYNEFSDKNVFYSSSWGGYRLATTLGTRACLYCNRNYINTVVNSTKNIVRPEFDHFLPKSKYKILAISFYNLIPSCHICNSNLKGKKDFKLSTHFHPYLTSFDLENLRFSYRPISPKAFQGADPDLEVILDTSKLTRLKTQIEANIDTFKLNYIYTDHKDIIEELLRLQRETQKEKLEDIFENVLKNSAGDPIFSTVREVYEFTLRNYFDPEEFSKKPMAKFEKDIAKELGLI